MEQAKACPFSMDPDPTKEIGRVSVPLTPVVLPGPGPHAPSRQLSGVQESAGFLVPCVFPLPLCL